MQNVPCRIHIRSYQCVVYSLDCNEGIGISYKFYHFISNRPQVIAHFILNILDASSHSSFQMQKKKNVNVSIWHPFAGVLSKFNKGRAKNKNKIERNNDHPSNSNMKMHSRFNSIYLVQA